jgi:cyclophilin family peptidyl-prolyl cis-trans isomerase
VARGGNIEISNDSQFYVTTGDAPHLNGKYTNFGQITSGQDVVDRIKVGAKIKRIAVA